MEPLTRRRGYPLSWRAAPILSSSPPLVTALASLPPRTIHMSLLATTLLASIPAALPPTQDEELFSFWIADLETFFADPKDAGLLRALQLVDDRVLELPDEIPGFQIPVPPEVFRLGLHAITGEKSLRVLSSNDTDLMFPVYGQLELMGGDEQKAREIAGIVVGMAQEAGAPLGAPGSDGLTPIEGAPVPIMFGARGGDVILSAGKVIDTPIDLSDTGLPPGVKPSMTAHMNVGAILEMASMFAPSADPEASFVFDMLGEMGLDDFEMDMATGSDAERSYTSVRMPRYAGHMRANGVLPARGLTHADVALVPADAVWASVATANFQGTLDMMLTMMEEPLAQMGMGDPIEMIAGMTGFHIEADLVDHLGDVVGVYTSDTTGGGGLLSMVAFIELKSPDGLLDTAERLQDMLNGLADAEAEGYIEARSWDMGGTTYMTLTFPGLPVPAEPTLAFTDSHMIMALTASSCVAAVGQAKGEGMSLLDHPRFRENLPGPIDGAYSVAFFDSPRMMKDGYGVMNLACSALANGTRSRHDATRDAGIVMPSYHELMRGAKASVSISRVVGDDYISQSQGDRSVLVNATSMVGFIANTPILLAIPAAIVFMQGSPADMPMFIEDF
jgi:hypothetical protein